MAVTEGKQGAEKGNRAKYMSTEEDLTLGVGAQCNIQIMCHRNVHLKPIRSY